MKREISRNWFRYHRRLRMPPVNSLAGDRGRGTQRVPVSLRLAVHVGGRPAARPSGAISIAGKMMHHNPVGRQVLYYHLNRAQGEPSPYPGACKQKVVERISMPK